MVAHVPVSFRSRVVGLALALALTACDRPAPERPALPPPPKPVTTPPPAEAAASLVSEDRAVTLVSSRLRATEGATPVDCLRVYVETTSPDDFELAVREKHDAKCPGDSAVEPIVDRWRVDRRTGELERYDAGTDRWGPAPPG
jgi:hypothetical protein